MAELREPFALFDRKTLLDELLAKSPQPGPELPSEPLLVGEVGLPFRPKPPADPIERWTV